MNRSASRREAEIRLRSPDDGLCHLRRNAGRAAIVASRESDETVELLLGTEENTPLQEPRKAIHVSETKDDPEFVAFFEVADQAIDLLQSTIVDIVPLGKAGRQNVYLHWWMIYLGTLLYELATASARLLVLDMPRAAIITIRQVFEYSIRAQYLQAHPDEGERLMDSMQKRVSKEAQNAPGHFSAELRESYEKNYREWAARNPDLDSESKDGPFTSWAREVLGPRFDTEFFRGYAYPSIIAHAKPHGAIDVLEPIGPGDVKHYWDSRTIDGLSELSKLASMTIEFVAFLRSKYGLDISRAFELNELHARIQDQFGYIPKRPGQPAPSEGGEGA